jgi:hypothetical protein
MVVMAWRNVVGTSIVKGTVVVAVSLRDVLTLRRFGQSLCRRTSSLVVGGHGSINRRSGFPREKAAKRATDLTSCAGAAAPIDLVIDDAKVFNDKLREWEDYYNDHRPHGGLDGQTPYERLRQKTQTRP